MNFSNPEYFVSIVAEGSISRAADKLFVAQPSLSQYLKKLERQLGAQLIKRDSRGVALTPEGEIFYDYARKALTDASGMQQRIKELRGELSGEITLFSGVISVMTSLLFCEFHKLHNNVTLTFLKPSEQPFDANPDIIITTKFSCSAAWVCRELIDEELLVAVPIDHPLAGRASVRLDELANEKFIFSNNRENDLLITRFCIMSGFRPGILIKCDNLHTVMSIVSYGIGITVVAASNRSYCSSRISLIHISEPTCTRKILMYRPAAGGSEAADSFADYIQNNIARLNKTVQTL